MTKIAPLQRRHRVFEFIVNFKGDHDGNSPTIREIADGCDVSSTSVVNYYLEALERDGLIVREYVETDIFGKFTKSRMIRVVGAKWNPPTLTPLPAIAQTVR